VTVTATALSGAFDNAISLTCSGLPKNLTCSFSPASMTPGSSAVRSVLAVSAAATTARDHHAWSRSVLGTWLLSFGLFGFTLIGRIQRRRIVIVLGACGLAAMVSGGTSCGGGSTSTAVSPSSPTSSTITVNGNSASAQLSTTVVVTVN